MKIIEITRGEKPKGHCFKFGVTTEHDYYIAPLDKDIETMPEWEAGGIVDSFINKVKGITKRKNFEYSKQFRKFNDKHMFPELEV